MLFGSLIIIDLAVDVNKVGFTMKAVATNMILLIDFKNNDDEKKQRNVKLKTVVLKN